MNILKYWFMTQEEFLGKLRQVRLRGFNRPFIYQDANIQLTNRVDARTLTPPQRYVLNGTVNTVIDLYHSFRNLGVDIFDLNGALFFWLEGSDPEVDNPIPFLPPIVEDSCDREGRVVKLINDGMHRCCAALDLRHEINVVHISNLPEQYPYYAYPFTGGWNKVVRFDELPDEFQKKDYRNPDSYKALFRQFNEIFPGVQEQRKQSNPAHIKQ